ncbi:acyclic terpene utilization AtuA family protein, partial [Rhizobium johnstonii]
MTTSAASTEVSARSKARKRAIDILYQSDVRGDDLGVTLAVEAKRASSEPAREASWLYAREIVDGGPVDVLTGDWLAELTMGVLVKQRKRSPEAGFARTFVRQLEGVLA